MESVPSATRVYPSLNWRVFWLCWHISPEVRWIFILEVLPYSREEWLVRGEYRFTWPPDIANMVFFVFFKGLDCGLGGIGGSLPHPMPWVFGLIVEFKANSTYIFLFWTLSYFSFSWLLFFFFWRNGGWNSYCLLAGLSASSHRSVPSWWAKIKQLNWNMQKYWKRAWVLCSIHSLDRTATDPPLIT